MFSFIYGVDLKVITLFRSLDLPWIVDYTLFSLSDNHLLKGGVFLALLWWFWGTPAQQPKNRVTVLAILFACCFSIAVNQLLKSLAPLRLRPYAADLPGVDFPYDLGLEHHSSFPSDHAALFFCLATGLLFISRKVGALAWAYAILIIALPRIYLGLHYPSDILTGTAIGVLFAIAIVPTQIGAALARPFLRWSEMHPASFYACFFLFTYQLATLFDDLRALGTFASVLKDSFLK